MREPGGNVKVQYLAAQSKPTIDVMDGDWFWLNSFSGLVYNLLSSLRISRILVESPRSPINESLWRRRIRQEWAGTLFWMWFNIQGALYVNTICFSLSWTPRQNSKIIDSHFPTPGHGQRGLSVETIDLIWKSPFQKGGPSHSTWKKNSPKKKATSGLSVSSTGIRLKEGFSVTI